MSKVVTWSLSGVMPRHHRITIFADGNNGDGLSEKLVLSPRERYDAIVFGDVETYQKIRDMCKERGDLHPSVCIACYGEHPDIEERLIRDMLLVLQGFSVGVYIPMDSKREKYNLLRW